MSLYPDDMSWLGEANCAGMNARLFFPEVGINVATAKATCADCTVRCECLDYAIRNHEGFGVWGGLSPEERRVRVSRRRRIRVSA